MGMWPPHRTRPRMIPRMILVLVLVMMMLVMAREESAVMLL
jgi:hypothetical protein